MIPVVLPRRHVQPRRTTPDRWHTRHRMEAARETPPQHILAPARLIRNLHGSSGSMTYIPGHP